MIETQYITLDMKPSGVLPVLYCSQYDIGRPLGMVVYNSGEVVDLSGYTVTIEATRTDGTAITAAVTTDGNIGAFETTATMTNKADRYGAQLVLTASGQRVASLPFMMCVIRAAMDENAESIEEDASLYQQYTATVQTIIAAIRSDLTAETTARQSADAAEQAARIAADNALQAQITAATTRKFIVIADSYADSGRGGYTNGFYTVMLAVLGMTDGVNAFLYQKGGAGFVGAGQGKTFGDLLEDAIGDMTADERATITDIYVCGGANDKDSAVGTVSNAKDAFYNRARSQFPNAWIHYAMISGFLDYGQRVKLYNISHYVYYYNANRNLDFITNAHLPMCLTESFSGGGDKVHPSATGCKRIGWLLASAFRSKSTMGEFFTRGMSQSVTGTPLSGITASDGNPVFRIYTAGTTLQIASTTTWHFNGSFTITYNNGLAVYLFSYPLNASGGIVANNATNVDIPGFGAIPVVAEAYISSTESITLPGELNIVYDDANQYMKVGFHARTAPKGVTATILRIKPFNHTTVY